MKGLFIGIAVGMIAAAAAMESSKKCMVKNGKKLLKKTLENLDLE